MPSVWEEKGRGVVSQQPVCSVLNCIKLNLSVLLNRCFFCQNRRRGLNTNIYDKRLDDKFSNIQGSITSVKGGKEKYGELELLEESI